MKEIVERKRCYCTRIEKEVIFQVEDFRKIEGIERFFSDVNRFVTYDYIHFMTRQLYVIKFHLLPANFNVEAEGNMTKDGKKYIFHFEISNNKCKEGDEPYMIYQSCTAEKENLNNQNIRYYFDKNHRMESWGHCEQTSKQ